MFCGCSLCLTDRRLTLSQGIMIVYDITNPKSFENVKNWIKNIEENASDDVELMLLGNKCDMEDSRAVTREQGEKVCPTHAAVHAT